MFSEKKRKVFTEIESDFSAEIRNSKVFSAQNQVFSKEKKKKGPPAPPPRYATDGNPTYQASMSRMSTTEDQTKKRKILRKQKSLKVFPHQCVVVQYGYQGKQAANEYCSRNRRMRKKTMLYLIFIAKNKQGSV